MVFLFLYECMEKNSYTISVLLHVGINGERLPKCKRESKLMHDMPYYINIQSSTYYNTDNMNNEEKITCGK